MGFLRRLLIPRKVRRVAHPVRAVRRGVKKAVVPKSVRKAMWTAHQVANPVDTVAYAVERSLTAKRKPQASRATVHTHEGRSAGHRSAAGPRRVPEPGATDHHSAMTYYDHPATPDELSAHFRELREARGNQAYIVFLERYVELVLETNPNLTAHIGANYVRISDAERRASPAYANHTGKIDIDVPPREALALSPFVGVKDPAGYNKNHHRVFVSVREHPSAGAVNAAVELTLQAAEKS